MAGLGGVSFNKDKIWVDIGLQGRKRQEARQDKNINILGGLVVQAKLRRVHARDGCLVIRIVAHQCAQSLNAPLVDGRHAGQGIVDLGRLVVFLLLGLAAGRQIVADGAERMAALGSRGTYNILRRALGRQGLVTEARWFLSLLLLLADGTSHILRPGRTCNGTVRRESREGQDKITRGAGCVGRPHFARSRVGQGVEESVAGTAAGQAGGGASRSGAEAESGHQVGAALLANVPTAVAKAAAAVVVVQRREVIDAARGLGLRRLRLAAEAEGIRGGAHARRRAEYIVLLALLRKRRALVPLDGRHVPTTGC